MAERFDPYYKWLGIGPEEQPPNHYRLLGIRLFEADPEVIDAAANRQMAYLQLRAVGPHAAESQRLLSEMSAARLCLLAVEKKAAYDISLRDSLAATAEATEQETVAEGVEPVPAELGFLQDAEIPAPPSRPIVSPDARLAGPIAPRSAARFKPARGPAGWRLRTWVACAFAAALALAVVMGLAMREEKEVAQSVPKKSDDDLPHKPAPIKSVAPSPPKWSEDSRPRSVVSANPKLVRRDESLAQAIASGGDAATQKLPRRDETPAQTNVRGGDAVTPKLPRRDEGPAVFVANGGGATKDENIAAALDWLFRHQFPDGRWSMHDYPQRCTDRTCSGPADAALVDHDVAATAVCLLPFLAAGLTEKTEGPYRATIKNGLVWLVHHEQPDGDLAQGNVKKMYSQGLAAIVFCEAYRLSKNAEYRNAAQRAINYIVKAQNQQTGGWQYNPGDPGDTCVVGWQVAALESARHAKLLVPRAALDGARHWLDSCAKGSDHSLYAYVPANPPTGNMTAIGLRCRQYLGALPNDPMFVAGVPYLRSRTLVHDPATAMDLYGCYFAIQVVHRMGPDVWNAWNSMLQGGLRASQNAQAGLCLRGSWDASNGARIKIGGRLLMTAVATLILEMPYSQLSIHQ